MKIPRCCGKEMKISIEMSRFVELCCEECGDIVYMKKNEMLLKPKLIDD